MLILATSKKTNEAVVYAVCADPKMAHEIARHETEKAGALFTFTVGEDHPVVRTEGRDPIWVLKG
jgi:hypothetical protein